MKYLKQIFPNNIVLTSFFRMLIFYRLGNICDILLNTDERDRKNFII